MWKRYSKRLKASCWYSDEKGGIAIFGQKCRTKPPPKKRSRQDPKIYQKNHDENMMVSVRKLLCCKLALKKKSGKENILPVDINNGG